jgi:hypothetical protein
LKNEAEVHYFHSEGSTDEFHQIYKFATESAQEERVLADMIGEVQPSPITGNQS